MRSPDWYDAFTRRLSDDVQALPPNWLLHEVWDPQVAVMYLRLRGWAEQW